MILCRLILLGLLVLGAEVSAEEEPVPVAPVVVADELNRGTPLRSVEGFLAATDANDFETAAEYLDLRNIRGDATN